MDWKAIVKTVAPTLGGLLATVGGPAGMLASAGLNAVASALGVEPNEDAVAAAVQAGLSPEQRVALVDADTKIKLAMVDAGVKTHEIDAGTEKAYIGDVADARAHNANTVGILRLGYLINIASYACVACVLYGCFWLLGGRTLTIDPGIAAMVGGLIGAALQWLLNNAAQANGFFFGSSPASRQAAVDLGKAASVPPPVRKI